MYHEENGVYLRMNEYSNDEEIDKVELNANYNKLEELTNKFL